MKRANTPFDELANEAFVRIRQIVPDVIPFSTATIYRLVKGGTFPKPYRLGDSAVAWRVGEVREWIANLKRADQDDTAAPVVAARKSIKARTPKRADTGGEVL